MWRTCRTLRAGRSRLRSVVCGAPHSALALRGRARGYAEETHSRHGGWGWHGLKVKRFRGLPRPLEKLIQLADIFEVSLDYLVMGQPMEESPIRNEVLFKRFKLLETFDDQDKDTVIRVIDAIIAQRQVEHAMRPLER
ncbi:hypothetical protein ACJJIP_10165 [Microbulbifer sp. VTAC004]|uniref:hypothetical protein n=1 Tax=Microbulbifer sp. VTAC004 TaxID=3243386 RepID=UPI00403A633A